jgi:hypothetical protein
VERFEPPTINGSRLAYCWDSGSDCGYNAALFFCQQHGHYDVTRFGGPVTVDRTIKFDAAVPACTGSCQAFSFIECSGAGP